MKPIYIGLIVTVRAEDVFDQVNEDADWNLFDPAYSDGDDGTIDHGVGYDYAQVLHKNYKFFYAQMSGKLPDDHPIEWRGDSAINDGKDHGIDLSGGYYDGGGFIKYNFPMAFSTTMLAWSTIKYWRTIERLDESKAALDTLRWGTDYLMKCHPEKGVFYVQVSDKPSDEIYWGRAEDITYDRTSYKIDANHKGTEPVAEAAAALAAASIVFRQHDSYYADDLIRHAEQLFEMAWLPSNRAKYHQSITMAAKAYKSWNGFYDELAWAALWLYKATGKPMYLTKGTLAYKNNHLDRDISLFSWENKVPGLHVLLSELTGRPNYTNTLKLFCRDKMPGGEAKRTPLGMVYLGDWGALRYAAGSAGICYVAADLKIDPDANKEFARSQLDYILGDTGRSFIVGFGVDPPTRVYHKESYCPPAPEQCGSFTGIPNPHSLDGALVGGPDEFDRYEDDPWKQQQSSVALDYNAVFTFLLLGQIDNDLFPGKRPVPLKPGKPLKTAGGAVGGGGGGGYAGGSMANHGTSRAGGGGGAVFSGSGGSGKDHDYHDALGKTLLFYDAQRAGELPTDYIINWRQSATLQDSVDDADLTGGFFDAAGTMKYTFPLAHSMTLLAWSVIEFPESYGNHLDHVKDIIKHGVDWLMEANPSNAQNKIYAVVGNQTYEDTFWGRAADMKAPRITEAITESKPGSDLAAEVAAAFASASIVFADDEEFKSLLISRAASLLQFAEGFEGRYSDSVPRAAKYSSRNYQDELAWGNLWLFKASGQATYFETAQSLVDNHDDLQSNPKIFNVDTKVAAVQLLMAMEEDDESFESFNRIKDFCNFYENDVPKTTKGLAYPTSFGATGVAASSSFLCILAAQKLAPSKTDISKIGWNRYGLRQINYLLGSSGRSYLIDYGANYPTQPFHKGSSCPSRPIQCTEDPYKTRDNPNMQILKGALVAGPDQDELFEDKRLSHKFTAVSLDRNAVFSAALAAALSISHTDQSEPVLESSALEFCPQSVILLISLFFQFL